MIRLVVRAVAAALALAIGAALAEAPGERDPEATATSARTAPAIYRVVIEGVEDAALLARIRDTARLVTLEDRQPPSLLGVDRRGRADVVAIEKLLRSEGYYAARVDYRIEEVGSAQAGTPALVTLELELGPRYLIDSVRVEYPGLDPAPSDLPQSSESGIASDDLARAERVIAGEARLQERLRNLGYPFAEILERDVLVDHAAGTMSIVYRFAPGDRARFGSIAVEGTNTVDPAYVRHLAPWAEGDVYSAAEIERYRRRLLDTGIFALAQVETGAAAGLTGAVDITVRVEERRHRSVGFGVNYSTDEGFGVEMSWAHRNLFGRGERIELTAELAEIEQGLLVRFVRPNFPRFDHRVVAEAALTNQDTDAFTGPLAPAALGIERPLGVHWRGAFDVVLEGSNLTDDQGAREFLLGGVSAKLVRDDSDDPFDPTTGTRLRLDVAPYLATGHDSLGFVSGLAALSGYRTLRENGTVILAGRIRLGSVSGAATTALPANHRFYAGGGGSVRGFAFQAIGPRSPGGRPLGGRSLLEAGLEVRTRITDTIGGVVFVDAGAVYDAAFPDGSETPRFAAGIGGRYFTPVGPLRFDLGFPINRRSAIDDPFQFYISIGQAY